MAKKINKITDKSSAKAFAKSVGFESKELYFVAMDGNIFTELNTVLNHTKGLMKYFAFNEKEN